MAGRSAAHGAARRGARAPGGPREWPREPLLEVRNGLQGPWETIQANIVGVPVVREQEYHPLCCKTRSILDHGKHRTPIDMKKTLLAPTLGLISILTMALSPQGGVVEKGDTASFTFKSSLVNGMGLKNLEGLRGKPVLFDFWGTK